jgi:hypothetical protein
MFIVKIECVIEMNKYIEFDNERGIEFPKID